MLNPPWPAGGNGCPLNSAGDGPVRGRNVGTVRSSRRSTLSSDRRGAEFEEPDIVSSVRSVLVVRVNPDGRVVKPVPGKTPCEHRQNTAGSAQKNERKMRAGEKSRAGADRSVSGGAPASGGKSEIPSATSERKRALEFVSDFDFGMSAFPPKAGQSRTLPSDARKRSTEDRTSAVPSSLDAQPRGSIVTPS